MAKRALGVVSAVGYCGSCLPRNVVVDGEAWLYLGGCDGPLDGLYVEFLCAVSSKCIILPLFPKEIKLYKRYVNLVVRALFKTASCGLVVRVPGYRSRSRGFDSRRYQIF
jgi:hypothetical protein